MKLERWHEVEQLLHEALELNANQRAAFLLRACAADEGLRREVESLLEQEARAEHSSSPRHRRSWRNCWIKMRKPKRKCVARVMLPPG